MFWAPSSNDYRWTLPSSTARPAAAFGTSITPGNNTMGSWASVISSASVTHDIWGFLININSVAVSATAKDCLVDIGIDPAGGSSYTTIIPTLLASCAAPYNVGSGGVWYFFPLWKKSGCTVAARAQVNNATVGTARVFITLLGDPVHPETTRVGQSVEAIGVDTANSRGTVVTLGTTSDGAWTSLGTTTNKCFFWQVGFGTNDTTMTAAGIHLDIASGDATNKKILIQDSLVTVTTAEQIQNPPLTIGCAANVAAGATIYGRGQSSAATDTQPSIAAYGVTA